MKLVIHHNTRYRYSQPLLYTVQTLHLWPVSSACQNVEFWEIRTPGALHAQPDSEGNRVHSHSLMASATRSATRGGSPRERAATSAGTTCSAHMAMRACGSASGVERM